MWLRIQLLKSNCTITEQILSLPETPLGRLQSFVLSLQMTCKDFIQGIFCQIILQSPINKVRYKNAHSSFIICCFHESKDLYTACTATMPFSVLVSSMVAAAARFHTCMLTHRACSLPAKGKQSSPPLFSSHLKNC